MGTWGLCAQQAESPSKPPVRRFGAGQIQSIIPMVHPRAATLPACASNRDGAGVGTPGVFYPRCPRAMARPRPFTSCPLSAFSIFHPKEGGRAARALEGGRCQGATRGSSRDTGGRCGLVPSAPGSDEVSLSLSASLPPRCVLRSARAASKREPRWAAARRGVPTPTTTRVPSTQVSPTAGMGVGDTWGPPPPSAL